MLMDLSDEELSSGSDTLGLGGRGGDLQLFIGTEITTVDAGMSARKS
jgi:hypothetical protein